MPTRKEDELSHGYLIGELRGELNGISERIGMVEGNQALLFAKLDKVLDEMALGRGVLVGVRKTVLLVSVLISSAATSVGWVIAMLWNHK